MSVARISGISYQSLARVTRMVNESRSAHWGGSRNFVLGYPASLEKLLHLLSRSIHGYLWTGAPLGVLHLHFRADIAHLYCRFYAIQENLRTLIQSTGFSLSKMSRLVFVRALKREIM
jgi:hypothetical protein